MRNSERNQKNKIMKLKELLKQHPTENHEKWFDEITNELMNHNALCIGNNQYRIVECEIYYNNKTEKHSDPFIHGKPEQLKSGTIYFHGFGVDLTFGDAEKNIHGGILIRSVRNVEGENQYTNGPYRFVEELFCALGEIINEEKIVCIKEFNYPTVEHPKKCERYNLSKKIENDTYRNKPYRYIIEINKENEFEYRSKIITQLYKEGKLSAELVKNILNYLPKIK
jgi:3-methyladenine DNA glycosylase Mpg